MWSATTAKPVRVKVKSSLRCTLWVGLVGNNKAYQTTYQYTTCGVNLCIVRHGKQRMSFFEKWHGTKDLKALKNKTLSAPAPQKPTRTSPIKHSERKNNEEATKGNGDNAVEKKRCKNKYFLRHQIRDQI